MTACCNPTQPVVGSGSGGSTPTDLAPPLYIRAEDMQTVIAGWAVNGTTPLVASSNEAAILERLFPGEAEETGVGWTMFVPASASDVTITLVSRAETTPGGVVTQAVDWYARPMPDGAPIPAWSFTPLGSVSLPASEDYVYTPIVSDVGSLGLTPDRVNQIELVTQPTGTTLTGGWALLGVLVEFS